MRLSDAIKEPGSPGFWDKKSINLDDAGFFLVARNVAIKKLNNVLKVTDNIHYLRCDAAARFGPTGLHDWDADNSICSCGSVNQPDPMTNSHHLRFDNMVSLYPVIEALPYGYILYMELLTPEDEELAISQMHTDCARTLQELFKLMLEWDWAYTELGNREVTAALCHDMLGVLGIPESAKLWLNAEVPAEKVGRFMAGLPNARERSTDPLPDIPDEFSEWLYEKVTKTRAFGGYDT